MPASRRLGFVGPALVSSLAVAAVMAPCRRASAQTPPPPPDEWTVGEEVQPIEEINCDWCAEDGPRTLFGHTYVPSTLVDWPFITSRVESTTNVGAVELDLGNRRILQVLGREGSRNFVLVDQSAQVSAAFGPWVSLTVRGQGVAVIPTSRTGALFVGSHAEFGGDGTLAVRLFRAGRLQATVFGDAGYLWTETVVPARLPRSPFASGNITTVRPGAAFALTITPRVGLQVSGSFAWRWFEIFETERIETLTGGAALTFALHPVPLTVLVAGQISADFGRDTNDTQTTIVLGPRDTHSWGEVGVVYRGRRELDVGITARWNFDDEDLSREFGQFRLAYYF